MALLGLRSHRGLISGQAVAAIWALRLWGVCSPFHAFSRSRTPLDQGLGSDTNHDLVSWGIEWRPVPQHAPGDAGKLVSERNSQLVTMHAT